MRTVYAVGCMGAEEWTVYLADSDDPMLANKEDPDVPYEGLTDYTTRRIYINKNVKEKHRASVLVHELMHAAAYSTGLQVTLKLNEDSEERLAYGLGNALAQFLREARMLRLPRKG